MADAAGKPRKNSFQEIDALIYGIRKCAYENGDRCGESCDCERRKEEVLMKFDPLLKSVLKGGDYPCVSYRDDCEQELKTRLLELIYEWDDQRGIYFVLFVRIMMYKLMLKLKNKVTDETKKRNEDYRIFDITHHDKMFDKALDDFHSDAFVYELMGYLTDKQKEAVECRYVRGMMVNEIADKLNVSPGAVSNLLKRAYKTLGDMLDGGI